MRVGIANWSEHLWLGSWASVELSSRVDCENESEGSPERDLRHPEERTEPSTEDKGLLERTRERGPLSILRPVLTCVAVVMGHVPRRTRCLISDLGWVSALPPIDGGARFRNIVHEGP